MQLTKLRVHFDRLFGILQCLWQGGQLRVAQCSVIISTRVIRVPLDTLGIQFYGPSKISGLEQNITTFSRFRAEFGVDICRDV